MHDTNGKSGFNQIFKDYGGTKSNLKSFYTAFVCNKTLKVRNSTPSTHKFLTLNVLLHRTKSDSKLFFKTQTFNSVVDISFE